MGAKQCKLRLRVVETYFLPGVHCVADHAILFRVIFWIQESLVDVFVAIIAPHSDIAESPAVFLLMAGKARGGHVGAFQLEFALIVLFDREGENGEPLYTVTNGTIRIYSVSYEFPFVIIDMAVEAIFVLQRICEVRLMAGLAVYRLVLACKGECCLAVVEMIHSFNDVERFFAVTGAAILSELVVVHIFVAIGAVGVSDPLEFLELLSIYCLDLMTFAAFNILMHPEELIVRTVVIKFVGGPELGEIMAFGTIGR
jgi:hypothetical protein